ncbi:MAG TPA: 4'-phosphopantetheinyl transferase superfamily protein [Agriterribacter sp.]|nr:4'-phosphopantetheinyl transferase superfamily protein [Agriterribacter sp.]
MPLFYQHNINESTKLGVWRIVEPEDFFLQQVPLQQDITHPHKRLQHLAGRYLLRVLFPEFPHDLIEIASTKKPFLPNEAFHFSISHCGDYAAAIVSRKNRAGIDIEIPTPKVARVRHKFLHAEELAMVENASLKTQPGVTSDELFFRRLTLLWSAKEAVFKWYGNGEVDFSTHIRLEPTSILTLPKQGKMDGAFVKEQELPLVLHYINFQQICLVWVVT